MPDDRPLLYRKLPHSATLQLSGVPRRAVGVAGETYYYCKACGGWVMSEPAQFVGVRFNENTGRTETTYSVQCVRCDAVLY